MWNGNLYEECIRMNRRLFLAASMGTMALLGCDGDAKPGTPPGKSVSTFNPLNVTGDDAGEKRCQI